LTLGEDGLEVAWDLCELAGACVDACLPGALEMVGRPQSVEAVLDVLEDDRIYFDESRGGVTFSGGEPFAQPDFLRELLEACRERELPVVLDTCGHVEPELFRELAPLAAHLLFDLKLVDEARHEAFTGVHNRWILENLRWAAGGETESGRPALTVRIPLIPGVNDDNENLDAAADLLKGLSATPAVDLLPYHRLGVDKYERLGREYSLSETDPPPSARVREAAERLRDSGLRITVRGEHHGHD
jgi:pyruvate formate lyase activating enzyme